MPCGQIGKILTISREGSGGSVGMSAHKDDSDFDVETNAAAGRKPLVVDMDGTLLATDMLLENICWVAGNSFPSLIWMPYWLSKGRSHLKAKLAEIGVPPVENLPYNAECLALITKARSTGTMVVLASASNERIVEAVAASTGLFDKWYGSTASHNLAGKAKADLLVKNFGNKGFDFAGDAAVDLEVWPAASTAYSVSANARLRRALDASHDRAIHLGPTVGGLELHEGSSEGVETPSMGQEPVDVRSSSCLASADRRQHFFRQHLRLWHSA